MSSVAFGCLSLFAATLLTAGCGDNTIPAKQVAESPHFRLWIDYELALPDGVTTTDVLWDLENNWTDMHTFFAMPDTKIDYYWLAENHIKPACESNAGGCQHRNTVISGTVSPNQHELSHAYAALLRPEDASPFLAEGLATSIGCHINSWPVVDVPWRSVMTAEYDTPGADIYAQGARFTHHLITAFGMDAYLRYYRQAPATLDADALAANFLMFWSQTLDDVWAAMLATSSDRVSSKEIFPICPCSLNPMISDGTVHPELQQNGYWRVPEAEGDTLAVTSPNDNFYLLLDCAAETTDDFGFGTFLVRSTSPHRVVAASIQATRAPFMSDTCSGAAVYDLPVDQFAGQLNLVAKELVGGSGGLAYVQLRTSTPRHVWSASDATIALCSTCNFDSPACAVQRPGTPLLIDGSAYMRVVAPARLLDPRHSDVPIGFGP